MLMVLKIKLEGKKNSYLLVGGTNDKYLDKANHHRAYGTDQP